MVIELTPSGLSVVAELTLGGHRLISGGSHLKSREPLAIFRPFPFSPWVVNISFAGQNGKHLVMTIVSDYSQDIG